MFCCWLASTHRQIPIAKPWQQGLSIRILNDDIVDASVGIMDFSNAGAVSWDTSRHQSQSTFVHPRFQMNAFMQYTSRFVSTTIAPAKGVSRVPESVWPDRDWCCKRWNSAPVAKCIRKLFCVRYSQADEHPGSSVDGIALVRVWEHDSPLGKVWWV